MFVSYILEHLKVNGRAGIIVPEGIIFQSGNAYKQLRKMLVEDGLLAVVSLPSGVFNPYAGVKTSVLLFDERLSKKTKDILFLKIANDGYDLGAQRRSIDKNDLPQALEIIKRYKKCLSENQEFKLLEQDLQIAHLVLKEKIAGSGDCNLTGDRYKEVLITTVQKWPMVEIGSVCNLVNGKAFKPSDWSKKVNGALPIIRIQNLNNVNAEFNYYTGKVEEKLIINRGDLLFSWSGSKGTSFGPHIWNREKAVLNQHIFKVEYKNIFLKEFLYYMLKTSVKEVEENLHGGVGLVHITKGNLERIKIPLPPLKVQKEFVTELDGYQKIIDGARQVVKMWRPSFDIDSQWEKVKLGNNSVIQIIDGDRGVNYPKKEEFTDKGYCLFLNTSNVRKGYFDFSKCDFITKEKDNSLRKGRLQKEDVVLTTRGTLGNTAYYSKEIVFENIRINSGMVILRSNKGKIFPAYLLQFLNSNEFAQQVKNFMSGSAQPQLPIRILSEIRLPLPSLEIQKQLVAQIGQEYTFINSNKKLIEIYEHKIESKIAEVWNG